MPTTARWGAPILACCAVLALLVAPAVTRSAELPSQDYHLHPGDRLLVGVFDDEKLKPLDVTITPDGKFSFPLIGELTATGKTAEQLRVEIQSKLKKYYESPSVTLIVTDVKGNVAYVIGQVNKPGSIEMNPAVTVLQALSIAGGLNPYAKGDSIIVIRNSSAGQRVLRFHYGPVIGGKDLDENIELESGDVVVVP
jgi:polysaccharide export outer membrane protein